MMKNSRGLTLIEMITVVAIIAILASVIWPQFKRYQFKNNRTDAIAGLGTAVDEVEKCASATGGDFSGCVLSVKASTSPLRYYTIAFQAGEPTAASYVLVATQVTNTDEECRNFTLDNIGVQGNTGAPAPTQTVAFCWSH